VIVGGVAGEAVAGAIAGETVVGAGLAGEGGRVRVEAGRAARVAEAVLPEEEAGLTAAAVAGN
jgi:hypothetical protein